MHLKERFEKFTEIETIDKLENDFLPKIKMFGDKIDNFIEIIDQCRATIRTFDESICVKASKGELLEMKHKIEDNYVSFDFLGDAMSNIESLQNKMNK